MLENIKKLEYRINIDNKEVIDLVYNDGTKSKILYTEFAEELAKIETSIEALIRRRSILNNAIAIIEANRGRGLANDEQILNAALLPDLADPLKK